MRPISPPSSLAAFGEFCELTTKQAGIPTHVNDSRLKPTPVQCGAVIARDTFDTFSPIEATSFVRALQERTTTRHKHVQPVAHAPGSALRALGPLCASRRCTDSVAAGDNVSEETRQLAHSLIGRESSGLARRRTEGYDDVMILGITGAPQTHRFSPNSPIQPAQLLPSPSPRTHRPVLGLRPAQSSGFPISPLFYPFLYQIFLIPEDLKENGTIKSALGSRRHQRRQSGMRALRSVHG